MDSAENLAIEVESLVVSYGSKVLLDDLRLRIPAGTVYGLVGPAGVGKSAVIRVLASIESCRAEVLRIGGIDLLTQSDRAREIIGYLPESGGFTAELTVDEYLDTHAAYFGLPKAHRSQITGDLLELVDLTAWRKMPIGVLSADGQRRLGLVRCLLHDPPVLLLDEPFAGLDPASYDEISAILTDLSSLGTTILCAISTCSQVATGVCTTVGIMSAGKVAAEGKADEMQARLLAGLGDSCASPKPAAAGGVPAPPTVARA
jgi:ABC-2 type transport system ATP-binding protein